MSEKIIRSSWDDCAEHISPCPVRPDVEPSAPNWLALATGYGAVAGALALAAGIAFTRLLVGSHGGTRAVVILLATTGAIAVAATAVGGPFTHWLVRRWRER